MFFIWEHSHDFLRKRSSNGANVKALGNMPFVCSVVCCDAAEFYGKNPLLRAQKYRNPQKQVAILGADTVRWS